jgi:hypothetical protein
MWANNAVIQNPLEFFRQSGCDPGLSILMLLFDYEEAVIDQFEERQQHQYYLG